MYQMIQNVPVIVSIEAYLESSGISTMELFCVNSLRLNALKQFSRRRIIADAGLGSKHAFANCLPFTLLSPFHHTLPIKKREEKSNVNSE